MAAPADAAEKAMEPAPGRLMRAEGDARVLFEGPHAGLVLPVRIAPGIDVSAKELRRDADIFVDDLCVDVIEHGADLLAGHYSRYVVDLNRAVDDVDRATVADHPTPRLGRSRGVVWRSTTRGRVCVHPELDYASFCDRIDRYYTPYHRALQVWLERTRERHGFATVLAAHSMPSRGAAGEAPRADVVPGSLGGRSCAPAVLEVVDAVFRDAGLSVRHDDPYRGGHTTAHYGRPADGQHVLQLELNRALYVDEETSAPKAAGYAELRATLNRLAAGLSALELPRA